MSSLPPKNGTTPSGKPRLFSCSVCSRAFARQEHLKRHERSHTKEKPFACGVCSRKFSRRDLLLRHAQKLHVGCADVAVSRLRKKPGRRASVAKMEGQEPAKRFKSESKGRFEHIAEAEGSNMSRRASFSAMSGANYAMPDSEVNYATESVEFSTPQLLPVEENPDMWHMKQEASPSGYSFYDVPTRPVDSLFNYGFDTMAKSRISPITQLSDEDDDDISHHDLDTINELERLTDMNASKNYKLPTGYSFYGTDNQTFPNSTTSSNATISPILLDSSFNPNPDVGEFDKYSRVLLFTNNLRGYIYHSLAKYPFIGIPSPTLPENDKLNEFAASFESFFLNHHPFIHKSLLNEYAMIRMVLATIEPQPPGLSSNETIMDNTKVSFVCLPLLIATIGAVVSNRKTEASNLYEASRRCIHVYLDSRKKKSALLNVEESSSPLWLIQSLTLSIIYGLFADNDISLNVIIRQVNALSSLIKSSGLNVISWRLDPAREASGQYLEFIKYESTIRTIHTIFHMSSLLSSLYNIVPSLKIDDLFIDLPCDTILWECMSVNEFQTVNVNVHSDPHKFNKVLGNLISLDFDALDEDGLVNRANFFFDNNVSEFGLVCLQDGLHQYNYFHQLTELNTNTRRGGLNFSKIISSWDKMCESNIRFNQNSELLFDSKLLNRFLAIKTSPVFNLNRTKESLWLKSWNEMFLNFQSHKFALKETDFTKNTDNFVSLVGNSLEILKLVFFKQGGDLGLNTRDDQLRGELDFERFPHKLSLNFQILFDVFLSLTKFLTVYEANFTHKTRYRGDSGMAFVHHFQLTSAVLRSDAEDDTMELDSGSDTLFGLYERIFKVYLNLEFFLKVNYGYNDFESEFSSLTISNILSKRGTSLKPHTERDLMTNELISFRLPFKLLKVGEFLFSFIYEKNLKFINFRNLASGLSHLRTALENNEDY